MKPFFRKHGKDMVFVCVFLLCVILIGAMAVLLIRMSPVSMLLAGVVISDYKFRDMLSQWQCYIIAALRLLVIPIVSCTVLKLLGLNWLVLPALMVLAMPCGMNTIVFPKLVGQDCKPGAALAFITTLACIATIPLCMWILGVSL